MPQQTSPKRPITVNEIGTVHQLAGCTAIAVKTTRDFWVEDYERSLDQLIAVARPHLLPTSGAPFSPRPDGAAGGLSSSSGSAASSPDLASVRDPRSPDAAAEGAIPLPGSGTTYPSGLLTYEGLHDALIACHRDMCEGHFQFAPRDWPGEVLHYIIRHAEQQDEAREAAKSLHVAEFIKQRCAVGPDLTVRKTVLQVAYADWCEHKGITPLKGRRFDEELGRFGLNQKISYGPRWVGIRLVEEAREAAE